MAEVINLIGQKFGRWTVVARANNDKGGRARWICKCNCGNIKTVDGYSLRCGGSKSCGCLLRQIASEISVTHGHARLRNVSKIYRTWQGVLKRCTNPNDTHYKYYGRRGITVCERWRKFENFLKDMGECPDGHSIDRIDNDGNYCKENCRWATKTEQMRNMSTNHLITFRNKTQCLIAWSKELNINRMTLYNRVTRLKWPIEKALTTPVRRRNK